MRQKRKSKVKLVLKDRGPKFWYRLFTLFGYTFYIEGRWTGAMWEDGLKEYGLTVYTHKKDGSKWYLIKD